VGAWNDLNRISKQGEAYVLQFGRRGCACSDRRLARIRTGTDGEESLELDDVFESACS
jgi:hypothetical protein